MVSRRCVSLLQNTQISDAYIHHPLDSVPAVSFKRVAVFLELKPEA